ncbi:hypothetical protein C8Q76DRAFT_697191 [Earliella scabrosa]|nr:hypothetical protein C8Q76DRAFT_697191 [Earliella scabrosa]
MAGLPARPSDEVSQAAFQARAEATADRRPPRTRRLFRCRALLPDKPLKSRKGPVSAGKTIPEHPAVPQIPNPAVGASHSPSLREQREAECLRLADLYLLQTDRTGHALLPEYRARARANFDCSFEELSQLSDDDDDDAGPGLTSAYVSCHYSLPRLMYLAFLGLVNVDIARRPENTSVFSTFSLWRAAGRNYRNGKMAQKTKSLEPKDTVWEGDGPRMALSKDGYPLVWHFPRAVRGKTLDDSTEAILRWGKVAPMSKKGANDFQQCYMPGAKVAGRTRAAGLWHAIGHSVRPALLVCTKSEG